MVKLLLDRNDVDLNCPGENDGTPLACAADKGHERAVKLLLDEKGVDPNHPDAGALKLLGYATFLGHIPVGSAMILPARDGIDPNYSESLIGTGV